jgi:ADP-ribose pyrophosphatase
MKILQSDLLYEGRLSVVRERLENADGRVFTYETVQHPGAVVILPILDDGRFVLVEQYRPSLRQRLLELPAGTLEVNEDPAACAMRELQEEIGMAAKQLIPLGELVPAPGFCNERQYIFCAQGLFESRAAADEDEDIQVVVMARSEVEHSITTGRLNDAKSIALFCRAALAGLISK